MQSKPAFFQNAISVYSTFCKLLKLNYLEMIEMCFDQNKHIFSPLKRKNLNVTLFILVL